MRLTSFQGFPYATPSQAQTPMALSQQAPAFHGDTVQFGMGRRKKVLTSLAAGLALAGTVLAGCTSTGSTEGTSHPTAAVQSVAPSSPLDSLADRFKTDSAVTWDNDLSTSWKLNNGKTVNTTLTTPLPGLTKDLITDPAERTKLTEVTQKLLEGLEPVNGSAFYLDIFSSDDPQIVEDYKSLKTSESYESQLYFTKGPNGPNSRVVVVNISPKADQTPKLSELSSVLTGFAKQLNDRKTFNTEQNVYVPFQFNGKTSNVHLVTTVYTDVMGMAPTFEEGQSLRELLNNPDTRNQVRGHIIEQLDRFNDVSPISSQDGTLITISAFNPKTQSQDMIASLTDDKGTIWTDKGKASQTKTYDIDGKLFNITIQQV